MKKDFLIIVNPKAGKGKAGKYLDVIHREAMKSGVSFDILITSKRGEATGFAAGNLDKYENYIAVGGDGTVNEVINGYDINHENLPTFGVLPLGSGNDFGKFMHGKTSPKEILKKYFYGKFEHKHSDLASAEITEEDNVKIKFKFINALGIGFDSFVAKENLNTKILSGIASYVLAVILSLKKFDGVRANITADGKKILENKNLLLITIGNNKTSGGGFYLNPYAEVDDGLLDVTTVPHKTPLQILRSLPLTLINRTEKVEGFEHRNAKKIFTELLKPYIVHADGEIFSDKAKTVKIELHEKKITLIA